MLRDDKIRESVIVRTFFFYARHLIGKFYRIAIIDREDISVYSKRV